jgi:fibronectin type 3 domain-containing protein
MPLRHDARIGSDLGMIGEPTHVSTRKCQAARVKQRVFNVLAALAALVYTPCQADVAPPPAPPAVPAGSYCSSIYDELNGDLQAFNTVLATPPSWTPVPGGPTLYGGNLEWANGNTGPSLSGPSYLQDTVQPQLQTLQALGVQAILVPVLFPILYEPFYGSQSAYQPYLTFYTQVAQAVRAAGLKLIVDNEILFSNDTAAGWTNMNEFYGPLTWPEYIAARAQMAATIEQYMQPDYLMLANEPDTEAFQTGQQNLLNPADAVQMVQAEITAVQDYLQTATVSPIPKLGAGFGTWLPAHGSATLVDYLNAYTPLPLDYIDFHLLPINTVRDTNFLNNALTIASMAAAAGKPVAISQAWMEDEMAAEVDVVNIDVIRARGPFSFWAPLNAYFLQTAQALASYTNMIYMVPQFPVYFSAQQTYGGTVDNGGALNCTCTTTSCSDYDIIQTENSLATVADQQSVYTINAVDYYNQLVTTPDTIPPTLPGALTGTAGTAGVQLAWGASTDNIGVAGYNVLRCTPPAAGQPCAGVWIANSTLPSFHDSTVTTETLYNYQVQAFDFANNTSPLSQTLSLQTLRTSADSATNLVATAVSAQEINLSWSPPTDPTGLGQYQVFSGTSPSNLSEIVVAKSTTTTYKNQPLSPGTTYYYGVVALEDGIAAPMTPLASATTLPMPTPPSNVVATAAATSIALTWQENLQPNGLPISFYQIYQGTAPGNLTKVAQTATTIFTATSLTPTTTYYFEIVAVDTGNDDSMPSGQMTVTTPPMPAAPGSVVATATGGAQITVTWSENIPPNGLPIQFYNVYRGTSPTGLTLLTAHTLPQYVDTGVSTNTTYYYAIEAVDTGKDASPMSATVQATTPPMPAAPVNVAPTANAATQVTITWSENIPPNGLPIQFYNVYRGTSSAGLTLLTTRTLPQYVDTGVLASTTYYYAIEAVDTGYDDSPMSATAQVTTPSMPAAPANVVATANGATEVTVTWSENVPSVGLPIQFYNVYRGTSPTGLTKLTARTGLQFIDTGVSADTTYYYAIVAVDTGNDNSPMSATAQVTMPN